MSGKLPSADTPLTTATELNTELLCTCPLSGAKRTSINGLAIVIRRALLNWLAISFHVPTEIQARQM
jgi:hypothetical protein